MDTLTKSLENGSLSSMVYSTVLFKWWCKSQRGVPHMYIHTYIYIYIFMYIYIYIYIYSCFPISFSHQIPIARFDNWRVYLIISLSCPYHIYKYGWYIPIIYSMIFPKKISSWVHPSRSITIDKHQTPLIDINNHLRAIHKHHH